MADWTIFDPQTGEIVATLQGGDFEIKANVDPAHSVFPGLYKAATHRFVAGQPVARDAPIETPANYSMRRVAEYPPLGDLADAILAERQGDPSKMNAYLAACLAVKAKYPKD